MCQRCQGVDRLGKIFNVNVTCCTTVCCHRVIPRNVLRLIVGTHRSMNWWERGFLLQEWVWWTGCNSIGPLGAWGLIVCWNINGHHRQCCHTIGRSFFRCKQPEKRNSGNQTHRRTQLARQRARLLGFEESFCFGAFINFEAERKSRTGSRVGTT